LLILNQNIINYFLFIFDVTQKIETAYLFDLYETYLKKSIDRLKINSMHLARVVKECSDDKLDVFFKNVRKKNGYVKLSIKIPENQNQSLFLVQFFAYN
jgi:hypothetical protein